MVDERVLLISGEATFVDDLREPLLDGAAHAVFVRSTAAHASIEVDLSEAHAAPGVLAAIAAADNPILPTMAYNALHPLRFAQPLLAEHKVRYVGEPVAVIVAETREQAVDAAELVIIDYQDLPVVLTAQQAIDGEVQLFEPADQARHNAGSPDTGGASEDTESSNVIRTHLDDGLSVKSAPELFAHADVVIEHNFRNPRQVAAPIECRGATAVWTPDGHLHAWVSTQTPHSFRSRIAPMYDLALSQIHIMAGPFVGGALVVRGHLVRKSNSFPISPRSLTDRFGGSSHAQRI